MSSEFRVFTQRATLNSLRQMVRQLRDPARVLPLVDDEGRLSGRQGRWEVRSTGVGMMGLCGNSGDQADMEVGKSVNSVFVCCLYLCLGVTVSMEPLGLVHVRREEVGLCLCAVCIYVWALQ